MTNSWTGLETRSARRARLRAEAAGATPPKPVAAQETAEVEVPSGSVKDVVDWVGDDPQRRATALAVEEVRDKPRASLFEALEVTDG